MKKLLIILAVWLTATSAPAAFDHRHSLFDGLLHKHVAWNAAGVASRVSYAGFRQDQELFDAYLRQLSTVSRSEFESWSKPVRLAFLLNAYNAFTIKLILDADPQLTSIKELGSLFSSPWSRKFFTLLGEKRSLDNIEHDMIRKPGAYSEPRVHFALVCASIGCPALRDEAFVPARLDHQLEDSLRRFLQDKSRNRYNSQTKALEVSQIFNWYGDDFNGFRGYASVSDFLRAYAQLLADSPEAAGELGRSKPPLRFLDYDWNLNRREG